MSGIQQKRMIHLDMLRVIAAFSVVMLHSASRFWYTLDIYGTEWLIANSYDAAFRFGVPVFVMISGALFLNNDKPADLKRLYLHNILRLLILYGVWSCIYGIWDYIGYDMQTFDPKVLARAVIGGRYHLWFLPMLIGLYMLVPILKSWLMHAEKKNVQYFLILFLVFQIGRETLRALTSTDELHTILDRMEIQMACSYLGYFVLGYYLARWGVSTKWTGILCWSIIPATLGNIVLGNYIARRNGMAVGAIYDSWGVFTCIISVGLFLLFDNYGKKKIFKDAHVGAAQENADVITEGKRHTSPTFTERIIKELSANTFGIYVIHVGLMEELDRAGIHNMLLPNIIGIPLYALGCFMVCGLVAAILRRIPYIGKYLC